MVYFLIICGASVIGIGVVLWMMFRSPDEAPEGQKVEPISPEELKSSLSAKQKGPGQILSELSLSREKPAVSKKSFWPQGKRGVRLRRHKDLSSTNDPSESGEEQNTVARWEQRCQRLEGMLKEKTREIEQLRKDLDIEKENRRHFEVVKRALEEEIQTLKQRLKKETSSEEQKAGPSLPEETGTLPRLVRTPPKKPIPIIERNNEKTFG